MRTPVSGLDFSSQPAEPLDLAMTMPSSATFPLSFTQAETVMLPVGANAAAFPRLT